jgi:hypothetical protein
MNGNWELMPYTAWCSIKSVANCHSKTMIKFTSFFEKRVSKKQTMVYGDILKLEEKSKKKSSPKRNSVKEPKAPKIKVAKVKPKPKTDIAEVQEKPKIVRRKKVKLIIEE